MHPGDVKYSPATYEGELPKELGDIQMNSNWQLGDPSTTIPEISSNPAPIQKESPPLYPENLGFFDIPVSEKTGSLLATPATCILQPQCG